MDRTISAPLLRLGLRLGKAPGRRSARQTAVALLLAPLLWLARRPQRAVTLAALLAASFGGWILLRDSPLVSVEHVTVSGVTGPGAAEVDAALVAAAQRQSTLHVNVRALHAAVSSLHVVADVRVATKLPHTMHITVLERLPVAVLDASGKRTMVAADGTVLGLNVRSGHLPTILIGGLPSDRVGGPRVLAELQVLGAAPAPLLARVSRIYIGPNGVTASMHNGLLIFFGDDSLPDAKWISASRVLSSSLAAGASYLDVRIPGRPVAGGLPDATSSTTATQAGMSPTQAIAASLARVAGIQLPSSTAPGDTGTASADTATAPPATSTDTGTTDAGTADSGTTAPAGVTGP